MPDKQKVLVFMFRGQRYMVDGKGRINANGIDHFSGTWRFLGGSRHHWSNYIDVSLRDAMHQPDLLNGTLGWDMDNGTTRQWGGSYEGKLPRIGMSHIEYI